ncbi:MAG: DMT family transporter [Chitinophagales bacterium]|nr:DMT family transporter [Chitinophagales bacterium]
MKERSYLAHIAILLANLIYGANYTIAKWVMPNYIKPFGFIFLRVLGALLFFWIFHLLLPKERIDKGDFPRLFFCGIFGVALNQLMFFKGLALSTPVNASLMMVTTPILVMLIAILAKKEVFTWIKALGISLGAFGALLLLAGKEFNFSSDTALGNFFVFVNAASYGIYLSIVKPLMKKYKPLTIIKWVFLFGFIPVFFVGLQEFTRIEWSSFDWQIWLSVFYVVIGVTCFAYLFNIFALSKVNPSVVGIYIYLQPVIATWIAIYFQADSFDLVKGIAALCVFLGVYLLSFYKKEKEKI